MPLLKANALRMKAVPQFLHQMETHTVFTWKAEKRLLGAWMLEEGRLQMLLHAVQIHTEKLSGDFRVAIGSIDMHSNTTFDHKTKKLKQKTAFRSGDKKA